MDEQIVRRFALLFTKLCVGRQVTYAGDGRQYRITEITHTGMVRIVPAGDPDLGFARNGQLTTPDQLAW